VVRSRARLPSTARGMFRREPPVPCTPEAGLMPTANFVATVNWSRRVVSNSPRISSDSPA